MFTKSLHLFYEIFGINHNNYQIKSSLQAEKNPDKNFLPNKSNHTVQQVFKSSDNLREITKYLDIKSIATLKNVSMFFKKNMENNNNYINPLSLEQINIINDKKNDHLKKIQLLLQKREGLHQKCIFFINRLDINISKKEGVSFKVCK